MNKVRCQSVAKLAPALQERTAIKARFSLLRELRLVDSRAPLVDDDEPLAAHFGLDNSPTRWPDEPPNGARLKMKAESRPHTLNAQNPLAQRKRS